MKIYLASPFFNDKEVLIYEEVIRKLRQKYEVFVPREHVIENAWEMLKKSKNIKIALYCI